MTNPAAAGFDLFLHMADELAGVLLFPISLTSSKPEAYVRSKGISAARHEAMGEEFARAHGKVVRENVVEICDLNVPQASRLLRKMVKVGKLVREGPTRRWSSYRLPPGLPGPDS